MKVKYFAFALSSFFFLSEVFALSMPAPPGHNPGGGEGGMICPMHYSPVCGANGQTYGNSCQAQNAGQQSFRQGECQSQPSQGPDCVHCGPNPLRGTRPYYQPLPYFPMGGGMGRPFMQQRPMPWWAYHGQQRYPNFHYPGAWRNYGMNSQPYPGQGAAFAAKPNVYIEGERGESLEIEVEFINKSQHLVSTPDLYEGWKVEIQQEGLYDGRAHYPYLFYDFRFDHEVLQFEQGVCTDAKKLIPEMVSILKEMGHGEESIRDFEEHWSVKIPYADGYCFYPQFNKALDQVAKVKAWKVKNEAKEEVSVQRVLFVVQLKNKKQNYDFPRRPAKDVVVPSLKEHQSAQVREWGVAFLAEEVLEFSSP